MWMKDNPLEDGRHPEPREVTKGLLLVRRTPLQFPVPLGDSTQLPTALALGDLTPSF